MAKFQLLLFIHAHQPVGNFDEVLERAYAHSYLPFVELLARHPAIRVGLHYSGCLLEWIERRHPQFFERLAELVARNQVELLGGGFYEPILPAIPPEDRQEQIRRLADYLERRFNARPRGAWLAERVWEPQLPSTLAAAGVEYTLVDDNHFLAAGFAPNQLCGAYLAEDQGGVVKLIPGLKSLRYLIPYRNVEEVIHFLGNLAREQPAGFVAMGDDCEKFGVWPGTYEHCYRNGWLERFFSALEASGNWLELATPAAALEAHDPLGRADLPAASYEELMEWALPTPARRRFEALEQEFSSRPDVQAFLRGGIWRSFLAKYPEANLLHKKMLHVSSKIRCLSRSRRRGERFRRAMEEGTNLLLRAQCNDAYWHGVFGGLYAPHLRTALWDALVRAEALLEGAEYRTAAYAGMARLDFDADGREEIYLTSDRYAALFAPADGGTLAALDFRPAGVGLTNSVARRPESYHERLSEANRPSARVMVSIHEQARAKEEGLERRLVYDHWARHSFRLLAFPPERTYEDYRSLRLEEDAALAGGKYEVRRAEATRLELALDCGNGRCVEKIFSCRPMANGFELAAEVSLTAGAAGSTRLRVGLETVVNLLAATAADRYLGASGERYPLCWAGSLPASELHLVDEWQKVSVTVQAPGASQFWLAPIETVSESEEGFERVYQGSQILAVWPAELAAGEPWKGRLNLKVFRWEPDT